MPDAGVDEIVEQLRVSRHGGERRQVARQVAAIEPATASSVADRLLGSCSGAVDAVAGTGGLDADAHLDALRRLLLRRCDSAARRDEVGAVVGALRSSCGHADDEPDRVFNRRQLLDLIDVEHALAHAARVGTVNADG